MSNPSFQPLEPTDLCQAEQQLSLCTVLVLVYNARMAPGRVELPNPIKMLQNAASHFQNRLKKQRSLDSPFEDSNVQKLAPEKDQQKAPVIVHATTAPPPSLQSAPEPSGYQVPAGPITKDDLGRATWTLLHTLAAQYPQNPTRRQQKDVQTLVRLPLLPLLLPLAQR